MQSLVSLSLLASSAVALHEIGPADFLLPEVNAFDPASTTSKLDFDDLTGPVVVDLADDLPSTLQALYDRSGVTSISVVYDDRASLTTTTENAGFPGTQRYAACPAPRDTTVFEQGPFITGPGGNIATFGSDIGTSGASGFRVKFVETARQFAFTIEDEVDSDTLIINTYLTTVDHENGEVKRVLQESLEVPLECAQDANDPRPCAVDGRTDDGQGMTICFQADLSCFDEVEILRPTQGIDSDISGFCIDDLQLGAITDGRRLLDCAREATLAGSDDTRAQYVSVTSQADAEWQSIGLWGPAVDDSGNLTGGFETSVVNFGFLGEDLSHPTNLQIVTGGSVGAATGLKAFRYFPNPAVDTFFYEITSFWVTNLGGNGNEWEREAGHFHPSTICEPGCGGTGYEKHHALGEHDRQGFTVELVNTLGSFENDTQLEFQLAWLDYRNVGGDDSFPPHTPEYAPLELCVGPDVAHDFTSVDDWNNCEDLRIFGEDSYLADSDDQCCSRIVFGCVFLGVGNQGVEHLCLYELIRSEANITRNEIWNFFDELGAQIGAQEDHLLEGIDATGDLVRDAILEWSAETLELIALQADATKESNWEHFGNLTDFLFANSAVSRNTIELSAEEILAQIYTQENATRFLYGWYSENLQALVSDALEGLKTDTRLVEWAVPIINNATENTFNNVEVLLELVELLEDLPSDIDAHTMLVVEIAEKEVLVRLLQLKSRLRSIDGERKAVLDSIKAQLTVNRIKLEKTVDYIRRLSETSSASTSTSSSSSSS